MLKYEPETGKMPVLPGDVVYWVDKTDGSNLVRATKVSSVVMNSDLELELCTEASGNNSPQEIGKDVFLKVEEAESWADDHRKKGPFRFEDRATQWMNTAEWFPSHDGYYGIRIPEDDENGNKVLKAYYLCYSTYADEIGFYVSDRRNAVKLENVKAWIDEDYMDSSEEFSGNTLDFSYTPIEEMGLSVRAYNVLKRNGINLIRDLLKIADYDELTAIRNMSRGIAQEIIQNLESLGFDSGFIKSQAH